MGEDYLVDILKNKSSEVQAQQVEDCNSYTQKFGLQLSAKEAKVLVLTRDNSLREQERIEFGQSIIEKIIFAFCDSTFIYQDNYLESLEYLIDVFYLYKNESLDLLSDDELIVFMKEKYEGICHGSIEYLEDTCLEKFARNIRFGKSYDYEEGEDDFDE